METEKPKSNWTKFIEAFIGTFKDHTGKGSASRMTTFTCLVAMMFMTVAHQWYGHKASREIFGWWAVILISLLGINGPVISILDGLAKFITAIRGGKTEEKIKLPQ